MQPSILTQLVPQFTNLKGNFSIEALLKEIWNQLEKDGQYASFVLPKIEPTDLLKMHEVLTGSLRELTPTLLPVLLYRIDVSERETNLELNSLDVYENLAWKILQREALKVYFRLVHA